MRLILRSAAAFAIAALTTVTVSAQKVKLIEGDLSALKGQTEINATFDYEHLGVGKFADEKDYLEKKKADYDKKEPGRGDKWIADWKADRKEKFEPQFNELFSEHSDIKSGDFPNAKYTLVFKTKFVEPGYNIYVSRKYASIDGEAWIIDSATKAVVAKLTVDDCPGRTFGGNDYDTGTRLRESYAVAGKGLGKFIKKANK
ncbi:hypothetical protein SAMN05518672_104518 [Chitinophaga sp. CF118]|uniref:hypothetical protein n=1 Tax=Chitinophaga sp. CF118 TaxID=1884367 RepID=UPI0008DF8E47|nr:hypothetical protein [Chitinophaga sp. CF118]SFE10996.1 hypothetical protein SAMN05518672_104518 [Chitinophaga sp. CF118]